MKYINRTGITAPIGKVVKLDRDGRGVVLPLSSDTLVLGVVVAVISGEVEVVSDGIRMTFINGVFKSGDIVYLRKLGQTGASGSCYASSSPIVPYVKVGIAVEAGSSRMARVAMGISTVSSGAATTASTNLWVYYATTWSTPPSFVGTITGGDVYAYTLDGTTHYRLVPSPYNAGYDAFYSGFSSPTLSGLIVTRG
jgi:hypothetical protein